MFKQTLKNQQRKIFDPNQKSVFNMIKKVDGSLVAVVIWLVGSFSRNS
jgi:hypothetical protein